MSNLKKLEDDLAVLQAKIKATKKAEPNADIIKNALMNDDKIFEKLTTYTRDEMKIIAPYFVKYFDGIIEKATPDLEQYRAQKLEQKQRKEQQTNTQNSSENFAQNSSENSEQYYGSTNGNYNNNNAQN